MKVSEIKRAVNVKLKSIYPDIPRYGKEIKEAYKKPCFFPYIIMQGCNYDTKNFASNGFSLKIAYMQKEKDEMNALEVYDNITEGIGMYLEVGERKLLCKEVMYEWVGQKGDIMQISISFDFKENIRIEEQGEMAKEMNFDLKGELNE